VWMTVWCAGLNEFKPAHRTEMHGQQNMKLFLFVLYVFQNQQ